MQSTVGDHLNILVVTHGFIVAQMITFLYEELKCGVPVSVKEIETAWTDGNEGMLLVRMPNTAITKFELEVDNCSKKLISGTCTIYKSNVHLQ